VLPPVISAATVIRLRSRGEPGDGRLDLVVVDQVDEPVEVEARDADGARQTVALQLLHGAPGAVVVAEGLVDQVQAEVVEPEALE
jgi:hypothetical protein